MRRKRICILTGAGMSAESGIKTFRDADGLWEGHDVMEVATPEGWHKNRELVLKFYNDRRSQLHTVKPNQGHLELIRLEEKYDTIIITQNVDNLHEIAGSNQIIHLHGELMKVRSEHNHDEIYEWPGDLTDQDKGENNAPLRPHIVWFGEEVPELESAIHAILSTDIIIIIGTSMQVYPAASLTSYAPKHVPIYYIDPQPTINHELSLQGDRLHIHQGTAVQKVKEVVELLLATS